MITFDFETKSYSDLTQVGAWPYSEHPTTDVICCSYQIHDKPIQNWWPGKNTLNGQPNNKMPLDLYMAIMMGGMIEAHGAAFERAIWTNVMAKKYGWMTPLDYAWKDTMAVALYYSLPPGLDKLAKALNFSGKDPEGKRLISKYSKLYLKTAQEHIPEEDFKKFVAYCDEDVRQERGISDYLGPLPAVEQEVWTLDQTINLRGIPMDLPGLDIAIGIVERRALQLNTEFHDITGLAPLQHVKVKDWFKSEGLKLENMQADYLNDLIEEIGTSGHSEEVSDEAWRALDIRLAVNKASATKLSAMRRTASANGRAQYQTQYHGASTGRNTGRGFQPLNMDKGWEGLDPAQLVRDILYDDIEWLDMLYGNAITAIGKSARHWIKAEEGKHFICGDFAAIEAIVLACLAGEEWKVQLFRDGGDPYCEFASVVVGRKVRSKKDPLFSVQDAIDRQKIGKVGELAGGYQGWVGAWRNFDNSDTFTDEEVADHMAAWRKKHPMIVAFWADLEEAAIEAVKDDVETEVRGIKFRIEDEWLTMVGLNGKQIWYYDPQLRMADLPWHKPTEKEDCANETCGHEPRLQLTYMSYKEQHWERVSTYGGKLAENVTQFMSREILMPAKKRVEEAGYALILDVYDELLAEVDDGFGSEEDFQSLMEQSPGRWAKTWPISASVWTGQRYRK